MPALIGQVSPRQLVALLRPEFQVPDTGAGIPAYSAPEGTLYWDITNNDFYVNNDGAVAWTFIGGGGGAIPHNLLNGGVHPDTVVQAVTRGSLVYGNNTPAWDELVIGAQYTHLESDGVDVAWQQNITMADDAWIGVAANDLRVEFDLTDGDIMLGLGDAAGSDQVQVLDSGNAVVASIDSDGNGDFIGNLDCGNIAGALSSNTIFRARSTLTSIAGVLYGGNLIVDFAPAANFSTNVTANIVRTEITTAQARTSGVLTGIDAQVIVSNGIAASSLSMRAGYFRVDVEDASSVLAQSVHIITPNVDTGSCTSAAGLRIWEGTVGAGSITTLHGLQIEDITAGNTNWSIYTGLGNVHIGDDTSIGGTVTPLAQLHVDQSSAAGGQPAVLIDQGDVSEQHIVVSMDGADQDFPNIIQLDVTNNPAIWWDESEDAIGFKNLAGILVEDGDWIGNSSTTARLYFDSSGVTDFAYFLGAVVGIGIATPDGTGLHVHTASAGAVTAAVTGDDLIVENSGDGGISILVPDANQGNIFFGSPSDNVGAFLQWIHDSDLYRIGTSNAGAEVAFESDAATEAMRIDSSQDVGIGITAGLGGQLHVDQLSPTGGQPVIFLDQGDVSEEHIVCSMDGADQDFPEIIMLDVTGNPAFWWDESEDSFGFKNISGILIEDDDWIGFGTAGGYLEFDSTPAPDEIRVVSANLDLNNNDLILDTDGDTYLHAVGDDVVQFILATSNGQLDININGVNDFQFIANQFSVLVGSDIVMGDDTTIGLIGGGHLAFDSTPAPDQIDVTNADLNFATAAHGIIHVDGVAAGEILLADGTRYVPSDWFLVGTAGQTYTFPVIGGTVPLGTGANTQVVYWTGINTIAGDAGMTYNAATDSLTAGDFFTTDGGQFGISGNELLTVNAAGTFAFSGISGVSVEDGDWIGAGAGIAWLFDSGNGDITTTVNVGIGITAPDGTLHVHTASAGAVAAAATGDDLVVENSDSGGITVLVPDASQANLFLGSVSDNVGAILQWVYNDSLYRIGTSKAGGEIALETAAAAEAMRIDSSGNVGIGDTTPDARLDISLTDSTTATVTDMIILEHIGGVGVGADFGTGIRFDLEDNGGTVRNAARIGIVWQSAAVAENAEFQLWLNQSGTLYDCGVVVGPAGGSVVGSQRGTSAVDWQGFRGAAGQVASGAQSVISGGSGNTASGINSVVAGGSNNTAGAGATSTVGGGGSNTASGANSTVPGGVSNTASGAQSFAAGNSATASHTGSYVWSNDAAATASWGNNTWTARCHGGARFYSAAGVGTGVQLSSGGTAWAAISDVRGKENLELVGAGILNLVAQLPIYSYNLKSQDRSIRHISPTAQDFNPLFGFTEDELRINMLDISGVSLAAVRELILENRELRTRIEQLEQKETMK